MRIAVFASGGGSNFQSIVDATENKSLDASVVLCVASKPNIGVIDRADNHNIPVFVLSGPIEDNMKELMQVLDVHQVTFIALAGFLRKIPNKLIAAFPDRIVNIHPALLPAFGGPGMYGMHVHRAVIKSGAAESGATVHFVDEDYDSGPVILQSKVMVEPGDTPDTLAHRVLEAEHALYPNALQLFATGRIQKNGPRTFTINSQI